MEDTTQISDLTTHPLGIKPKGLQDFTHHKFGRVRFSWAKNKLSGDIMYEFSNSPAMYAGTIKDVNTILSNLPKDVKSPK
jgi:hypothetical protein